MQATFAALQSTYGFLTPELWRETKFQKSPMQEFTDFLAKPVIADVGAKPGILDCNAYQHQACI